MNLKLSDSIVGNGSFMRVKLCFCDKYPCLTPENSTKEKLDFVLKKCWMRQCWQNMKNQLKYSKFQIVVFRYRIFWILITLNNTVISKYGTKNCRTCNILITDSHKHYVLLMILFTGIFNLFSTIGHGQIERDGWLLFIDLTLIVSDILEHMCTVFFCLLV